MLKSNFKIQKALYLEDELAKKSPKLADNYAITVKIDGWFVYTMYDSVTRTWSPLASSRNRAIPSLVYLTGQLNHVLPKPSYNCVLIAEAAIPGMAFPELNGLLNRSKGACNCYGVVLYAHDLVRLDRPDSPYSVRLAELIQFLSYKDCHELIQLIEILRIDQFNRDSWYADMLRVIDDGGEGIVAKRMTSGYSFGKRNADIIKLKPRLELDLLADSVDIGIGDKGNPSYVLNCLRRDSTQVKVVVNSHAIQEQLFNNPNEILGKVVTVKAMECYDNGKLRQPTFAWVRPDKLTTDID